MYIFSCFLSVIAIFTTLPNFSSACNGYVYKFHYLKPCADNNIVVVNNPGSTLDKQCMITPQGCMVTTGFKTAVIHYRAEKKPLPAIEGDIDLCKALKEKNEFAMLAAHALNLPTTCPVDAQTTCADSTKKVSIAKYKSKLGMALGVAEVNVTIKHDTGTSCLSLKVEFTKPRRMG